MSQLPHWYAKYKNAVVTIFSRFPDGEVSIGSGFFFKNCKGKYFIATAAHVVGQSLTPPDLNTPAYSPSTDIKVQVYGVNGTDKNLIYTGIIYAVDGAGDLAILKLNHGICLPKIKHQPFFHIWQK
jgi:Holliday junction resolvasome RuvABC endonuclease subunit